jgi:hypothetical protein
MVTGARRRRGLVLGLLLIPFGALGAFAQDSAAVDPVADASATSIPAVRLAVPAVVDPLSGQSDRFEILSAVSNDPEDHQRAALGNVIKIEVQNLRALLQSVPCEKLVLFLGGMPIAGSPPESCNPWGTGASGASGFVRYRLDRTAESDRSWHALLAEPVSFNKKIAVSLGPTANISYPTAVDDFKLQVLPPLELYSYGVGLIVALVISLWLARRTSLLRDRNPEVAPGAKAPYSLSRFQLAFWSLLVIAAYIFIWMITEELDTITGSVLALLGIGAGTALGAAMIDQSSPKPAEVPAQIPAGASAPPKGTVVSRGFLRDVVSDAHGVSLYRFQLFAWTLVLGVIFCASVYDGLQMPQFSPTLLGLMGISSGTYLGFKVPEKQAAQRE